MELPESVVPLFGSVTVYVGAAWFVELGAEGGKYSARMPSLPEVLVAKQRKTTTRPGVNWANTVDEAKLKMKRYGTNNFFIVGGRQDAVKRLTWFTAKLTEERIVSTIFTNFPLTPAL